MEEKTTMEMVNEQVVEPGNTELTTYENLETGIQDMEPKTGNGGKAVLVGIGIAGVAGACYGAYKVIKWGKSKVRKWILSYAEQEDEFVEVPEEEDNRNDHEPEKEQKSK